jgi:hypothetical protein
MNTVKAYIFIFSFFFSILLNGQNTSMGNLWVGDMNNYLRIDSNAILVNYYWKYENKSYEVKRAYHYLFINDTLRVIESQSKKDENHDFIIKEKNKDNLRLVPLTQYSRILAFEQMPQKELVFKSQGKIFTDTIRFEKLLFATTNCYGHCPAMTIHIDSSGLLKFKGEKYAVKQGFYQAKLSNETLDELLSILGISEIDKVENHGEFNIDAPTHTLEIHYNNKVKFIKSAFWPFILAKLLDFLMAIPNKVDLQKMEDVEFKFSQ